MRSKFQQALVLGITMLAAVSSLADETKPAAKLPEAPDKEKLSYALGMTLGSQVKKTGLQPDPKIVAQAIKDVLAGMPTQLQEADVREVLRNAEMSGHLRQTSKNIAAGEQFLAANAKVPGVTVLPDGLQYLVLREGTGALPKRIDVLTINFRGTWIDGTEFRHSENFEIPFFGCTKGLQEALLLMKTGSKWRVFVPYTLAYGRVGERAYGFGSTLIYDLELIAADPETAHHQHTSAGRAGHSLDEDLLPSKVSSAIIAPH